MIDKIYIDEAVRIRKEYLENLVNVNKIEKIYHELLEKFENEKEKLSNINSESMSVEDLYKYVKNLDIEINSILEKIKPYKDKIEYLDQEQRILYNNIKEKYIGISDDEIYSEIIPVIEKVDEDFDL